MWDPGQYLRFAQERARPFADLLARVDAADPRYVADLGCGPGNLTVTLARRWPGAEVVGVDSSPDMIGRARMLAVEPCDDCGAVREGGHAAGRGLGAASPAVLRPGSLRFEVADIRDWTPERPLDLLVSNAVLQWVPAHLDLVRSWPGRLTPGGWLAFQLPGNYGQAGHTVLMELATSARWRSLLAGVTLTRQAHDPATYLDVLARAGCQVDAWETTYLHLLTGPDPVVEWYRGTGLRPVLAALDPARGEEFVTAYRERLRQAYPAAPYGTVLPFRRIFVVARRR